MCTRFAMVKTLKSTPNTFLALKIQFRTQVAKIGLTDLSCPWKASPYIQNTLNSINSAFFVQKTRPQNLLLITTAIAATAIAETTAMAD